MKSNIEDAGGNENNERREYILTIAWELFTRIGFKTTTIEQIARSAGIGKGTIYLHFRTKDELLLALVDNAGDAMELFTNNFLDRQTGKNQSVKEIFQSYLTEMLQYRTDFLLYRNLIEEAKYVGTPIVIEAMTRIDRRFENELARIIGAFVKEGLISVCDQELVAVIILNTYTFLIERKNSREGEFSEKRFKSIIENLIFGSLIKATIP